MHSNKTLLNIVNILYNLQPKHNFRSDLKKKKKKIQSISNIRSYPFLY